MSPKVILISLDGATASITNSFLDTGILPADRGLGLLRNRGVAAFGNETITPSLTAPSHIAIATGSTAVNNDINANSFHLIASPFNSNISGFGAPIGGYEYGTGIDPRPDLTPTAEPLWVDLRAAGKKVVAATFPGADGVNVTVPGRTPATIVQDKSVRTVDYTGPFGAFGGQGAIGFTLTAASFSLDATQATQQLGTLG
ncbi:MAG: alkaline phosphatase family protein, partial [Leptolyngbyaceae cyanobacterium bins.59]|nr:alkaline phosphatase family protein [Leptolyngbyaceae cyanobacterium bins.59]